MNNDNGNRITEDEIDLRLIGKRITSGLAYPFQLLWANKIITMVFMIAAVIISVLLKQSMPKTYSSSFIVKPLDAHEKVHFKMLYDIQTLLKFRDYHSLSDELKIDSTVCQKIVALKTSVSSSKNPADSSNIAEVTITTTDYTQFIPFQTALINYLERNPYFDKIRDLQGKQIQLELEQVEKDLLQLDSLKAVQLRNYGKQSISGQNSLLLNELVDPTRLFAAQTERINKKSNLMARSKFLDNFQLLKSCVVIRQATFPPRILVFCSYLVPVFLVICMLFLHLRSQRAKKRVSTEQSPH